MRIECKALYEDGWRRWFAWRPVFCDTSIVWLETIERKPDDLLWLNSFWEYRFPEPKR